MIIRICFSGEPTLPVFTSTYRQVAFFVSYTSIYISVGSQMFLDKYNLNYTLARFRRITSVSTPKTKMRQQFHCTRMYKLVTQTSVLPRNSKVYQSTQALPIGAIICKTPQEVSNTSWIFVGLRMRLHTYVQKNEHSNYRTYVCM